MGPPFMLGIDKKSLPIDKGRLAGGLHVCSQGRHGGPQPIASAEQQCPVPPSPCLRPSLQAKRIVPMDTRIRELKFLGESKPNGTIHVAVAVGPEHGLGANEVFP